MKKIFAALAFALSCSAFAGLDSQAVYDAGWKDLSPEQQAEVLKQVATAKAQKNQAAQKAAEVAAEAAKKSTPEKVSEWLDVGAKIGQMVGGAAKEVGIAVNEFVKTPVGQWTMFIIVWKYMGGVIVHVMGGVLVWLAGFGGIWYFVRRAQGQTITYDVESKNVFGNHPKLKSERQPMDSDYVVGFMCAAFVILIIGLVVIFSY